MGNWFATSYGELARLGPTVAVVPFVLTAWLGGNWVLSQFLWLTWFYTLFMFMSSEYTSNPDMGMVTFHTDNTAWMIYFVAFGFTALAFALLGWATTRVFGWPPGGTIAWPWFITQKAFPEENEGGIWALRVYYIVCAILSLVAIAPHLVFDALSTNHPVLSYILLCGVPLLVYVALFLLFRFLWVFEKTWESKPDSLLNKLSRPDSGIIIRLWTYGFAIMSGGPLPSNADAWRKALTFVLVIGFFHVGANVILGAIAIWAGVLWGVYLAMIVLFVFVAVGIFVAWMMLPSGDTVVWTGSIKEMELAGFQPVPTSQPQVNSVSQSATRNILLSTMKTKRN